MNLIRKSLYALALIILPASLAVAQSLTLGGGGDHDFQPQKLRAAPEMPLANLTKATADYSWRTDTAQPYNHIPAFVAQSREYRKTVSADQLAKGIELNADGVGAVITLNPVKASKDKALNVLDVQISMADGRVFRGAEAMDQLVDQTAIQATGIPFSNGMVGFRIRESLGTGKFVLRMANTGGKQRYVAHVLDKNSASVLSLSAAPQAFVDTTLLATGKLDSPHKHNSLSRASAYLLSPQGRKVAAKINMQGSEFTVSAKANAPTRFGEGLWELHASVTDQNGLQRDVKTAFAVAYPTARFDGGITRRGLIFDVGVEVASAGRYEASAILYATGADGLMPVVAAATATWLETGSRVLQLNFDQRVLKQSGLSAPFELRHLQLKDQSRLSVLQSMEKALHIPR